MRHPDSGQYTRADADDVVRLRCRRHWRRAGRIHGGGRVSRAPGARVVVLERDSFPRFHIGESLLASVNDVLDAIGAAEIVRDAGFPRKWGATFITADGSVERFADFAIAPRRAAAADLAGAARRASTSCCFATPNAAAPTSASGTA